MGDEGLAFKANTGCVFHSVMTILATV